MTDEAPDVNQTLEYRTDAAVAGWLSGGLGLCLLGLVPFLFIENEDNPAELIVIAGILLSAGLGVTMVALRRRSNPSRPIFVLSPAGIYYRIAGLNDFLIPWHEIRGIDSIDIEVWHSFGRPGTVTLHDVTVILLSKEFYDAHIHVSFLRRGPFWGNVFIPKGEMVQMALHHEAASVDAKALRAAVEARWRAFREGSATAARAKRSAISVISGAGRPRATAVVAAGADPRATTEWERIVIVVLLIGIALVLSNVLRLWATPGQIEAREKRRKWQVEEAQRAAEQRKMMEDLEKTRKSIDDAMRRMGMPSR